MQTWEYFVAPLLPHNPGEILNGFGDLRRWRRRLFRTHGLLHQPTRVPGRPSNLCGCRFPCLIEHDRLERFFGHQRVADPAMQRRGRPLQAGESDRPVRFGPFELGRAGLAEPHAGRELGRRHAQGFADRSDPTRCRARPNPQVETLEAECKSFADA